VTAIPLGRRLPGASSNPPGRQDPDTDPGANPAPSLFGFAPGGVFRAATVAGRAVRSYRTVSPLPSGLRRGRFLFCGTIPGVAPAGRYPAPYVHGARTFLPGSLSAVAGAAVRPTDGLAMGTGGRSVKAHKKMKAPGWEEHPGPSRGIRG